MILLNENNEHLINVGSYILYKETFPKEIERVYKITKIDISTYHIYYRSKFYSKDESFGENHMSSIDLSNRHGYFLLNEEEVSHYNKLVIFK